MRVKDAVGKFGEDRAVTHLEAQGLEIIERNWRCREGEVDIVARDGASVVFVEVKARSGAGFGLPSEAVTPDKLRRMRRVACLWLAARREAYPWVGAAPLRFDVVSIVRGHDQVAVDHLRGVS